MARSISYWQQQIIAAKNADGTLSGSLTSTSNTAIWLLWTYVVATCMAILDGLMDQFKVDVNALLAAGKAHTPLWYVAMAKKFQYGYTLVPDKDYYAVIDPSAQIVSYAAAQEQVDYTLRVKVCKTDGAELAPLASAERAALATYMGRIKDAGVRLNVTSTAHDDVAPVLHIFYDPLILDISGERLDGSDDAPVKTAMDAFLFELPFNSLLVLNQLQDKLEAVDGVVEVRLGTIQARISGGAYADVVDEYRADSGWIRRDDGLTTIFYVAHEPV